jgi:hypothetical protein
MLFRKKRVRRDPYRLSIHEAERPIRLDEVRLDPWALSIGQSRDDYGPRDKPHRGMLPDVDFSRAVPVERRPGLMTRLFRRIFVREREEKAQAGESGGKEGSHASLGEVLRKPYVWLVEGESEACGPEPSEPEELEPTVAYNGSRAA